MKILKIGRNYSDILPSFCGNISDEVIDFFDFLTVENDQFDVLFPFLRETSIPVFCHNISYWIQQNKTVYCIKIKLCTKKTVVYRK